MTGSSAGACAARILLFRLRASQNFGLMTVVDQKAKYSPRADVVRLGPQQTFLDWF